MVETNVPVMILKEIIVLPFNEVRIEFKTEREKNILNGSERDHDNYLLLVNLADPLEENPRLKELPKIAVLGKIKSKISLPNGIVRTVIAGVDRVEVLDYFEGENYIQSFVRGTIEYDYNPVEVNALKRILFRKLEEYIEVCSTMSNEVLGRTSGVSNISRIADIIASELPLEYQEKRKYIENTNSLYRVRMILEDLNKEIETVKMENEIESSLKNKLDEEQRKFYLKEKIRIIKEEIGEGSVKDEDILGIKEKLKTLSFPEKIKNKIESEINKYELTPSNSPEIGIIRTYIDWLISLPWTNTTKDNYNIDKAYKILEESHYGLTDIKERIIEYIAVKKKTNKSVSPIICLVGPPGTGKTSLAKSIAKSLNKKFVKISVGGVNDEAEIMGHRRTYIGASPGKIISGIRKVGVNNPVFLIDEIDKLTKDYKGDPASALLDVLDKEQNYMFVDNYIEEEFDLSNVTFILTANNLTSIPEALRDRLEIINLSSYSIYEKVNIAENYLIPKLKKEYNIKNIDISEACIKEIIINYTKEAGARELERIIACIFRKTVVLKKDNIVIEHATEYLGNHKYEYLENDKNEISGIVNALAYTPYGGTILKTSVTYYRGKGNIILTGSLGDVIKESVHIALSYIKANCNIFEIDYKKLTENDFHVHFESGAISKDGPSAGIAIVTSIIGLLSNKVVDNDISMTGEITLRGKILPVGGLREKIIAATVNNIKTIFIPKANENEVGELEDYIKKDLNIIYVNNYKEVYDKIFKS